MNPAAPMAVLSRQQSWGAPEAELRKFSLPRLLLKDCLRPWKGQANSRKGVLLWAPGFPLQLQRLLDPPICQWGGGCPGGVTLRMPMGPSQGHPQAQKLSIFSGKGESESSNHRKHPPPGCASRTSQGPLPGMRGAGWKVGGLRVPVSSWPQSGRVGLEGGEASWVTQDISTLQKIWPG